MSSTPQPAWRDAYAVREYGSTFERCHHINNIFTKHVPIPDARGDVLAFEFLKKIKDIVTEATTDLKKEAENQHKKLERSTCLAAYCCQTQCPSKQSQIKPPNIRI